MRLFPNIRRASVVALAASLALAAPAAGAKKKKKGGPKAGKIEITKVVNAPIPDLPPPSPGTVIPQVIPLISTTDIGRQGRGLRVRDVNVTVQTLGLSGTDPSFDVDVDLRSPGGAVSNLFGGLGGFLGAEGRSIGPLTLDDESILSLGSGSPVVPLTLYVPWQGRANPNDPLAVMDNGPVMGTWTLIARDFGVGPSQSSLVQWTLTIQTGKPYKTK